MARFKAAMVPLAVVAALGVAAPLSNASADVVTISDASWYGDTGITVTAANATYSGYPIGPQQVTVTDGASTFLTNSWCIDFNHDITVPGTYTYALVSFTVAGLQSVSSQLNTPEPAGLLTSGPGGVPNEALIHELNYIMGLGNVLLSTDPAGYGTVDDIASAIQIAIWEDLYSPDITVTGASSQVLDDIQAILADAATQSGFTGVGQALISSPSLGGATQQLAFNLDAPPVPEPGSLVLLGSALLGFGAIRRRRRARA